VWLDSFWLSFHLQYPQSSLQLAQPITQKAYVNFKTVLGVWHRLNKLKSLKLTIVRLLWIHNGHVVCGWTHFGSPFIFNTPKAAFNWPNSALHRKHDNILRQFWVSGTDPTN
jgi:hypothetical protein